MGGGGGGGQALGRLHSTLPPFRLSYHTNLYGKQFYYLLGNEDILFIYKISFILYQISNKIYKISNKNIRYLIKDIRYLI